MIRDSRLSGSIENRRAFLSLLAAPGGRSAKGSMGSADSDLPDLLDDNSGSMNRGAR